MKKILVLISVVILLSLGCSRSSEDKASKGQAPLNMVLAALERTAAVKSSTG